MNSYKSAKTSLAETNNVGDDARTNCVDWVGGWGGDHVRCGAETIILRDVLSCHTSICIQHRHGTARIRPGNGSPRVWAPRWVYEQLGLDSGMYPARLYVLRGHVERYVARFR